MPFGAAAFAPYMAVCVPMRSGEFDLSEAYARPRTPWAVWLLVAAIGAAYVAFALAPREAQQAAADALALSPPRFHADSPVRFGAWYEALGPIFGHSFLHLAWWHAALNAFFLFLVARLPASRLGPGRFLVLYFASVAGGALAFLALNWNGEDVAVGASGGVCGVIIAYFLAVRPSWRDALRDPRVRGPLGMLVFINVVLMGVAAETGVFPIAWEGHLGGFAAGGLAYILMERPPRGPWG